MRFRLPPLRRAALSLFASAALLAPASLRAQAPASPAPTAPDTALRVILLTIGPGDAVWEKFGHNAIWVHDPATGSDLAYNYGMFDFRQENFFLNFARGRMLYWMEGFDARLMVDHYIGQNRSIWAQELNLAPAQALALRTFLERNALPENRFYRYDYYRDNCSTRVRDAIDAVLGGALKAATDTAGTGTTYRWHTRRLTGDAAANVPIYTGLEAGLGPSADREISEWEEMFLPMKLRDGARALTVRDAAGRSVPLVRNERVLYEATRPAEKAGPPSWIVGYLLAGLALGGLLAFLATRVPRSRPARYAFSALSALWLLFAGTGGWILLGLWGLTDHAIAYRNENLLQLSPLALPLVLLLPALAYGARWAAKWAVRLSLAMAALSVLGLVLQVFPGIDQVNGEVIALALPVNLALAWAARRLAGPAPRGEAAERPVPVRRRAKAAA